MTETAEPAPGSLVRGELESQPQSWRLAAAVAADVAGSLPTAGQRVSVVGCGTSWFVAQSYAAGRELSGQGETDAFAASEYPLDRRYDLVVAISRSGTTTEVVELLRSIHDVPTLLVTAVPGSPAALLADTVVALPFADERSVVQTRFATSALALLRSGVGDDIEVLAQQAERALAVPVDSLLEVDQVTFLGRGPAVGLAAEAALKLREAARFWAESYPAMDYRHGPIAIAEPGRLVWSLGAAPDGLEDQVRATGAAFVQFDLDAMAGLVVAQRFAVALALRRGLDPDRPRSLTRSVILPA